MNHLPVLYNLQMFSFCNKKVLTKFVRVLAEGIRIMHEYNVSLSKGRSNSIKKGAMWHLILGRAEQERDLVQYIGVVWSRHSVIFYL